MNEDRDIQPDFGNRVASRFGSEGMMGGNAANGMIGVIGGMGPFASAEFVKTIYEMNVGEFEQHSPAVMLYSDPRLPDRTDMLLNGGESLLRESLLQAIDSLMRLPVDKLVICCMTAHHLIPGFPPIRRRLIVSLVELVLSEIANRREKYLVLCTNGARKKDVFRRNILWASAEPWTFFPDERDQQLVHDSIYDSLKRFDNLDGVADFYENLARKYGVDGIVSGCTEIHLLSKRWNEAHRGGVRMLDPLILFAKTTCMAQV